MEASRAADCYGSAPWAPIEIADAEQAYIQAELSGTPCWICLLWRTPCLDEGHASACCAVEGPAGHPDSGTSWENIVTTRASRWFSPRLRGNFVHHKLKLALVIYVDDFKLAGPTCNMTTGCLLQKGLIHRDTQRRRLSGMRTTGVTRRWGAIAQTDLQNMENFSLRVDRYWSSPENQNETGCYPSRGRDDQNLSLKPKPHVEGPSIECPW
jgi:hypothetical protein